MSYQQQTEAQEWEEMQGSMDGPQHKERDRIQGTFRIFTKPGAQHSNEPLHCRLVSHVVFGMTECWHWCGARNAFGYGRMTYQGRLQVAHRLSWIAFRGEIPEGMSVLHRCDNPSCINPGHLWLGTYGDNLKDAWIKGRHMGRTGVKLPPLFTANQVDEMRRQREVTGDSYSTIAKRHGVATTTIHRYMRPI